MHVGGVQMSMVATKAAAETEVQDDPPLVARGLMDAYRRWWQSVQQVHSMLELGSGSTEEVGQILDEEHNARLDYAAMLRSSNRPVADYLAEDKAFPPLWPTPEPPVAQR
jgi:hypothetical protein